MVPRAAYRDLIARGLEPAEAGNLTAFLWGLPSGGRRAWRLAEINRILFLRELHRMGRAD